MSKPDTIIIDGRAYSWRRLCELRKAQLEAWQAAQARQPALFALREDSRPPCERTASRRFEQPTLLQWLTDKGRSGGGALGRAAL
jgi:hypothetical protein